MPCFRTTIGPGASGVTPRVLGRTFKIGNDVLEIVGVAPVGFTGTEPGIFTDIFLPTMMHAGVTHDDWSWIRTFIQLKPSGKREHVRDRLQAVWSVVQTERSKAFTSWPENRIKGYLQQKVVVEPAAAGLSYLRKAYGAALSVLSVIVVLVLLIACANVANLLIAQAAVRGREMALRVSIGAGKWRLIQLMMIESGLLAILATFAAVCFAWWAAPFLVAEINAPDQPARLVLAADWRVMGFVAVLGIGVTFLFGLIPAVRASAVTPGSALKGGDDPHSRRRLMHTLIASQVAFCFVVHFAAGAFAKTLHQLSDQPTGFSSERLLALETISASPAPTESWYQMANQLQALSGVESVAIGVWPLLSGNGSNGFVSINDGPPGPLLAYFLGVSPKWFNTMKIPLLEGRDFRPADVTPGPNDGTPGVAIVNQAFAKEYFGAEDPVGRLFGRGKQRFRVVGLVRDARYRNLREPITPTAYIPIRYPAPEGLSAASLMVRTAAPDSLALVPTLRREVARARAEFRISSVRTQLEINRAQTARDRLLAALALFFTGVAVLLGGVGLYGVLDYSVQQHRRELGIRLAIGAPAFTIARYVTVSVFVMVLLGALAGGAIGFLLEPYARSLLYHVQRADAGVLIFPTLTILLASLLAALPAVIHAVRIDTVAMLRED